MFHIYVFNYITHLTIYPPGKEKFKDGQLFMDFVLFLFYLNEINLNHIGLAPKSVRLLS